MEKGLKKSMLELQRLSVDEFKEQQKTPIVLVLDNIRSAMNVGSAFRTSDAFRLEKIILVGITARPPHKEINKTAIGASKTVDWVYSETGEAEIDQLKNEGYAVYSIEQVHGSISLSDKEIVANEKIVLIFGNEVSGVSDMMIKKSDECLEIPQHGSKHSLNISVSLGIVVWDLFVKGNYLKK